jgi:hypothetical protein
MQEVNMPSSQNRRRIEIPTDLFEQLSVHAAEQGTTVAALSARLLRASLAEMDSAPEAGWQRDAFGTIQQQLAIINERLDALHLSAPIPPRSATLRNPRPLISTNDLRRQARRELIDELRRERDQHRSTDEASGESV